jgi:hypothetical protein
MDGMIPFPAMQVIASRASCGEEFAIPLWDGLRFPRLMNYPLCRSPGSGERSSQLTVARDTASRRARRFATKGCLLITINSTFNKGRRIFTKSSSFC